MDSELQFIGKLLVHVSKIIRSKICTGIAYVTEQWHDNDLTRQLSLGNSVDFR